MTGFGKQNLLVLRRQVLQNPIINSISIYFRKGNSYFIYLFSSKQVLSTHACECKKIGKFRGRPHRARLRVPFNNLYRWLSILLTNHFKPLKIVSNFNIFGENGHFDSTSHFANFRIYAFLLLNQYDLTCVTNFKSIGQVAIELT